MGTASAPTTTRAVIAPACVDPSMDRAIRTVAVGLAIQMGDLAPAMQVTIVDAIARAHAMGVVLAMAMDVRGSMVFARLGVIRDAHATKALD
ncbi:hypothetical protein C0991_007403 [Blastosporella zonata]|nr:hypothetical protein C0991_007403 [Blastosporella zonata]